MIWKFALYAMVGYLSLCALVFIFQRKLLYLPDTTRLPVRFATDLGLSYWPSNDNFQGFVTQRTHMQTKGTVIVFHGNAGAAYQRGFYAEAFTNQGLRVILAEYPGYGGREGSPSEATLVADALETIRLAYQEYGNPLYLWGESLGCGVAAAAIAKTENHIDGLALFLAWDSLANLAQRHYWYLPARWLVLDRYDTIANLQNYDGPIAIILAGKDEVVPMEHGLNLYEAISSEKRLWIFKSASHNFFPLGADLDWWREVVDFITIRQEHKNGVE